MPKNTLPATRKERIELALAIIGHDCTHVVDEDHASWIRIITARDLPTFEACVRYTSATVESLMNAGFSAVTSGSPFGGHDMPECAASFAVPVGEEE